MDTHGARHLRQPRDGFLHVVGVDHHQVRQFVDHDDQVGKRFVLAFFNVLEKRERLRLLERAVVLVNVAHPALRQQLQPILHFPGGVAQDVGSDLRVGDHRREKMRNILVEAQLEPLGIDEHQLHVVGTRLVEDGHHQ